MASSKDLIVYVTSQSSCTTYNVETKEFQDFEKLPIKSKNPKYFEQFQSLINFNRIKAFIFAIYITDFSTNIEDYIFRLRCCEFSRKHGIFCYFPVSTEEDAYTAISQTKTMVKEGEEILVIESMEKGMPPGYLMLRRENGYYKLIQTGASNCPAYSPSWKKEIIGNHKFKKIIYMQNKATTYNPYEISKMKKLFKGEDLTVFFPSDSENYHIKANAEVIQHLMGEKFSEYYIKTCCIPWVEVEMDGKVLMKASYLDFVPFEKYVVIDVNPKNTVSLYCSYISADIPELMKQIRLLTFKCKKVKVTLKIDIHSFYDLKVEPMEDEKENMDGTKAELNTLVLSSERAQMIFDRQNFSVSYFANNKETVLNDRDGSKMTPIYISFSEKKPIIGRDARNDYVENSKFVVFDLIKLCSISNAEVTNPNWDFKLSKEDESIIVTMQTFNGEKKATVDFLLALILKNGNDRIKKKYGKKMKEFEIGFDGFVPNEMLKKNFIEAGKLLNVNVVFE